MRLEEDVDAPEHLQRARVPVEDGKDGHLEEGEPLAEEKGAGRELALAVRRLKVLEPLPQLGLGLDLLWGG